MNALKCGVSSGDQGTGLVRVDVVLVWPGADTVGQRSKIVVPNGGLGLICEVTDHRIDRSFSLWDSEGAVLRSKGRTGLCSGLDTHTQLVPLENTPRCLC